MVEEKYKVNGYYPTIGIECHVQLKTATKLFAAVGNDAREAPPNTLVSHICFGMPGALPVLNEKAIEIACRAAFALETVPQQFSKFDRKHYFYPDLPKGYQITQYDEPIILGGSVEINVNGKVKQIAITRAHLEEDAGKSTHPNGADYSLVDLNRAGTPLLEIVSEPQIHSAAEAKAYARELYLRMKFADVSDANLYYGNMRFDVNVSVSRDPSKFGTRSETKNLNSFRSVEKAVEYEIKRQIELLEKGEQVVQETRGWHDDKQKTFSQRSKEDAHDYRYMPDPDVPPVVLTDAQIEKAKAETPILPHEWRKKFTELGFDKSLAEALLDAEVEFEDSKYLDLIVEFSNDKVLTKRYANWVVNLLAPLKREKNIGLKMPDLKTLIVVVDDLLKTNKLSSTAAKQLIESVLQSKKLPKDIAGFAEAEGLIQLSDTSELDKIVSEVLTGNQKAADDVRNGETKAIGFLIGQCMKLSKGQGNPQLFQELIKKQLGV